MWKEPRRSEGLHIQRDDISSVSSEEFRKLLRDRPLLEECNAAGRAADLPLAGVWSGARITGSSSVTRLYPPARAEKQLSLTERLGTETVLYKKG